MKATFTNLRWYPGICLQRLRKSTKNLSQNSLSPGWDLNPGPTNTKQASQDSPATFGTSSSLSRLQRGQGSGPYDLKQINILATHFYGRAIAEAVIRRFLTAKARVRTQISPCRICGGQSGNETGFSQGPSVLPCKYHSTAASAGFAVAGGSNLSTLYYVSLCKGFILIARNSEHCLWGVDLRYCSALDETPSHKQVLGVLTRLTAKGHPRDSTLETAVEK
jgi:hypothetical protein